jgi:hypothetical protein
VSTNRASVVPAGACWWVTEELTGCHRLPIWHDYPLLPGDLIKDRGDGTYGKIAPGLGIEGFVLTDEQKLTLKPQDQPVAIEFI